MREDIEGDTSLTLLTRDAIPPAFLVFIYFLNVKQHLRHSATVHPLKPVDNCSDPGTTSRLLPSLRRLPHHPLRLGCQVSPEQSFNYKTTIASDLHRRTFKHCSSVGIDGESAHEKPIC